MRINKKISGVVAVSAVVALGGGSAYAFWTTSGSGSGDAAIGTNSPLVITGDITGAMLLDVPQTFTIEVSNPASYPQAISAVSFDIDATDPGCLESWFIKTQPAAFSPTDIAAGGSTTFDATLELDNKTVNQDACKTSDVDLSYLSS